MILPNIWKNEKMSQTTNQYYDVLCIFYYSVYKKIINRYDSNWHPVFSKKRASSTASSSAPGIWMVG
jgi:hypothetical protein